MGVAGLNIVESKYWQLVENRRSLKVETGVQIKVSRKKRGKILPGRRVPEKSKQGPGAGVGVEER